MIENYISVVWCRTRTRVYRNTMSVRRPLSHHLSLPEPPLYSLLPTIPLLYFPFRHPLPTPSTTRYCSLSCHPVLTPPTFPSLVCPTQYFLSQAPIPFILLFHIARFLFPFPALSISKYRIKV